MIRPVGRLWRYQSKGENVVEFSRRRPARRFFDAPDMDDEHPVRAREGVGDRRLWCRRYDTCLSYAAAHDWDGFDCSSCDVHDEMTERERFIEAVRLYRNTWQVFSS